MRCQLQPLTLSAQTCTNTHVSKLREDSSGRGATSLLEDRDTALAIFGKKNGAYVTLKRQTR
jgi:hypothetical protein